ncbi:unnamed protein product [Caenorhabditis bovis]|uniref:Vacuolar protein sorting-associated protein 11 homolog n=1 Tax=Caenorhabditis bovis TaxID=2654633 RepID=A0A8S1EX88_9PELO|nr:unnamed protein product [Caenorhabditis bovis]
MAQDFGWRRFNFFDKNLVLEKEEPKQKFLGLKDVKVDCWCSSGNSVFLGETKGGVFRLTNQLDEFYWKAYQKSLACLHSAGKYLFSIGEDDELINSMLKIWDPDVVDSNEPVLKRCVRMSPLLTISSCHACCVAVHSTLSAVVVGFADGAVLFYHGDVLADKGLNTRWTRIRDPAPSEGSISGLSIAYVPGGKTVIFVITPRHVFSYVLENRTVVNVNKHEANGASPDCWTFDESTGQLVVASREMVYFYDADQCRDADGGVGRCLQLGRSQEKLQLVASGQYLALLTKQTSLIQKSEFMTMMTVYDIKGQYIGFACSLPSLCRLFVIGSTMYVLSSDGTLSDLTEKNLNTKLDILFKKNLFDVALGIAKNSKDGSDHLKSIHAKYADYLYSKGDYENAIDQYKETIGMLEPSYVIKKYLDGSKLVQLCIYLEYLHDAGKENSHHTNILLNAYAKRGEKKKIMNFLNRLIDGTRRADILDVFKILVQWNYLQEASLLATKFRLDNEALSVIIEKSHNYSLAVKYISKKKTEEALKHLERFGRILLRKVKDETISLLLDVVSRSDQENIEISSLLDIFIGENEAAESFIEFTMNRSEAYDSNTTTESELSENIFPLINKENEVFALHLAELFDCPPVVEYILKRSHRINELMAFYQKKNDLRSIVELCKSSEADRDAIWLDALSFVSKCDSIEHEGLILEMLMEIEKRQSVHPLVVLEILSKSENLTISAVKSYVINWLQKQEAKIAQDKKKIEENEKEMRELEQNIESLKFSAQVLQVSKCSACDTSLELPTVHFLCKHSFHVHCFESHSEGTEKCPACANQARDSLNDRGAHGKFQKELATCANNIELIAKYLEMGLFDDRKSKPAKSDAARRVSNLFGESRRSSLPDDEESWPASRSMSTVSSIPASRSTSSKPRELNPFDEDNDDKNPFGSTTPTSTNPFFTD